MNLSLWLSSLLAGVLCAVALPSLAANHTMTISGESGDVFTPPALTIQAGDTVTFVNAGGRHNAVVDLYFQCSEDCGEQGRNAPSSAAWSSPVRFDFDGPGTVTVFCEEHSPSAQGVTARITVEGSLPPRPPIGAGHTGAWFNPGQDGHGFFLQVLPDNRFVAAWYVYSPEGRPAWIVGSGTHTDDSAVVEGFDATGGQFMPNYRPENIVKARWGTMRFEFYDCTSGFMQYDSPRWGSGFMPLTRLTQPAGITCPPTSSTQAALP